MDVELDINCPRGQMRGETDSSPLGLLEVSVAELKSGWPKVEGPGEQLRWIRPVVWLRNGRSKLIDGCSGF